MPAMFGVPILVIAFKREAAVADRDRYRYGAITHACRLESEEDLAFLVRGPRLAIVEEVDFEARDRRKPLRANLRREEPHAVELYDLPAAEFVLKE